VIWSNISFDNWLLGIDFPCRISLLGGNGRVYENSSSKGSDENGKAYALSNSFRKFVTELLYQHSGGG
jgi:hypothetical protein